MLFIKLGLWLILLEALATTKGMILHKIHSALNAGRQWRDKQPTYKLLIATLSNENESLLFFVLIQLFNGFHEIQVLSNTISLIYHMKLLFRNIKPTNNNHKTFTKLR